LTGFAVLFVGLLLAVTFYELHGMLPLSLSRGELADELKREFVAERGERGSRHRHARPAHPLTALPHERAAEGARQQIRVGGGGLNDVQMCRMNTTHQRMVLRLGVFFAAN
jgi:hypothetical protein